MVTKHKIDTMTHNNRTLLSNDLSMFPCTKWQQMGNNTAFLVRGKRRRKCRTWLPALYIFEHFQILFCTILNFCIAVLYPFSHLFSI